MTPQSIRPVITGIGLVTPLGVGAQSTWDALLAGQFITDHAKVSLECPNDLARVSDLAIRAAREAAASTAPGSIEPQTALVLGTSKGPVEQWLAPPSRLSDVKSSIRFGLAETALDVARALNLTGPRLTVSAACASGLHALIRGSMLIQSGEARRVLVVAAEASVHPLFLGSFRRLGVLPPPGIGCRPFDRTRDGFLMSESAAAILLEGSRNSSGLFVERYALGADATHLTGIDPQGRALRAIVRSCIDGQPLDLIHAHGTGTALNDPIELSALDNLTPEKIPATSVYSHKGALGHSLGAAGLVSVVLNVMSHRTGIVLPNVRTTDALPAKRLSIDSQPVRRPIRRSLAVAAGFGGAMAAVTLRN